MDTTPTPETPADQITAVEPPAPPEPSQVDVEAEAAARRAAEQVPQTPPPAAPAPTVHEAQAAVQVPVTPSAPAAPAAPEPPAPVVAPTAGTTPVAAPAAIPAGPAAPSQDAQAASSRVMDAEWPFRGYSGPQPWEAENTPTLTQNHRMLSPGASGREVVELASLLGFLDYGSSITAGENPHAIYDLSLITAVQSFCRDYGVAEDPAIERARTPETVGPWVWEALTRAVQKKAAETA